MKGAVNRTRHVVAVVVTVVAAARLGVASDVAGWNRVLSAFAMADGRVDYAGIKHDADARGLLEGYVQGLATADMAAAGRDERLAFWINAYNALTVDAVVDRYPVASVMDVDGFFDGIRFAVAGSEMTLNELENERIRAEFDEPRVHFAVNCASLGCPPLRIEAYDPDRLDAQLEEQTTRYLRANTRLNEHRVEVSKVFEWFAEDFDGAKGTRAFVARYLTPADAEAVLDRRSSLGYYDWDWTLNDVRR